MASAPGGIGFPQLVHAPKVNDVAFSLIMIPQCLSIIVKLPYILYAHSSEVYYQSCLPIIL